MRDKFQYKTILVNWKSQVTESVDWYSSVTILATKKIIPGIRNITLLKYASFYCILNGLSSHDNFP